MSKKKRKLASRLKIAELKQACERPDVVEIWDVTAMDPKLLVYLKVRKELGLGWCWGGVGGGCGTGELVQTVGQLQEGRRARSIRCLSVDGVAGWPPAAESTAAAFCF